MLNKLAWSHMQRYFAHVEEAMGSNDPYLSEKVCFVLDDANNVLPATRFEHMKFIAYCQCGGREFRVAKDEISSVSISTVFIGERHCLFETAISGGGRDGDVRWMKWDDALAGHQEICRHIREGL